MPGELDAVLDDLTAHRTVRACAKANMSPSPGADVGGVSPSPGADVGGVSPSPGADVGGVSPSPGADVAGAPMALSSASVVPEPADFARESRNVSFSDMFALSIRNCGV